MRPAALAPAGAGLLAATLALAALRWTTPDYATLTGPIPVAGAGGERVAGRRLAATVAQTRLAERVTFESFGRATERTTAGVWVEVLATLEADEETTTMNAAAIVGGSGRRYEASARVAGPDDLLIGALVQPGLPRRGFLLFELPRDELPGAVLRLSETRDPRLDSELAVPLALENEAVLPTLALGKGGGA